MKQQHMQLHPVRQISDNMTLLLLPVNKESQDELFELEQELEKQKEFEHLVIEDFCPSDPRKKYCFIQNLQSKGLPCKSVMLTYFHGNNVGNSHFIWQISEEATSSDVVAKSQHTIEALKGKIPIYHTQAMCSQLLSKYGRISPCLKPSLLRIMYNKSS